MGPRDEAPPSSLHSHRTESSDEKLTTDRKWIVVQGGLQGRVCNFKWQKIRKEKKKTGLCAELQKQRLNFSLQLQRQIHSL